MKNEYNNGIYIKIEEKEADWKMKKMRKNFDN